MDALHNGLSLKLLVIFAAFSAAVPASAQTINAVVRLKEKVSIESLAQNVQDPSSARFWIFYTPEEIRNLVAPSQQDYATVLAQLRLTQLSPFAGQKSKTVVQANFGDPQPKWRKPWGPPLPPRSPPLKKGYQVSCS